MSRDAHGDDTASDRQINAFAQAKPDDLGFDPERLIRTMDVVVQGRAEGAYPGAVALVMRHGKVAITRAIGHVQLGPAERIMTTDTIFDLASVTKVVAGVSPVLLLVDAGAWSLDDPVVRFLPSFATGGKGVMTLRHILTHTSGLPPWRPCYVSARTATETIAAIGIVELDCSPGAQVQYSDLGMALIRMLVETVSGMDFGVLLQHHLFHSLRLRDTSYQPPREMWYSIAATERGNRYERAMVGRAGLHFDRWRDYLFVGEVNDGNTYYALQGVSSHAGLFAMAADLAHFGQIYLQDGEWQGRQIISASTIHEVTRLQTATLNDCYGLGWRLPCTGRPSTLAPFRSAMTRAIFPSVHGAPLPEPLAGKRFSAHTYGHTEFTGTSIVVDPANDIVLILLTNRIHPDATRGGIDRVRDHWHDAVAAAIAT